VTGGYVTEVNTSGTDTEDSLRRQSELRGQQLMNLPRSWANKEQDLEAPGSKK